MERLSNDCLYLAALTTKRRLVPHSTCTYRSMDSHFLVWEKINIHIARPSSESCRDIAA